jgi:hypothetical protein
MKRTAVSIQKIMTKKNGATPQSRCIDQWVAGEQEEASGHGETAKGLRASAAAVCIAIGE